MSLKKRVGASKGRLAGLASSLWTLPGESDGSFDPLEQSRTTDFLLGLCLLGPLSILGEVIILKTHHRPLGAATYASFALLSWIGFGLLVRTLTVASNRFSEEHGSGVSSKSEGGEGELRETRRLPFGRGERHSLQSQAKLSGDEGRESDDGPGRGKEATAKALNQRGRSRIAERTGPLRIALWVFGLSASAGVFLRALWV